MKESQSSILYEELFQVVRRREGWGREGKLDGGMREAVKVMRGIGWVRSEGGVDESMIADKRGAEK